MRVRQWQCGDCGAWLDAGWSRHVHMQAKEPTMTELRAMRTAEEAGLEGIVPDAFDRVATTTYWRTFKEPMRDKQ
jgi:hypothetical protein